MQILVVITCLSWRVKIAWGWLSNEWGYCRRVSMRKPLSSFWFCRQMDLPWRLQALESVSRISAMDRCSNWLIAVFKLLAVQLEHNSAWFEPIKQRDIKLKSLETGKECVRWAAVTPRTKFSLTRLIKCAAENNKKKAKFLQTALLHSDDALPYLMLCFQMLCSKCSEKFVRRHIIVVNGLGGWEKPTYIYVSYGMVRRGAVSQGMRWPHQSH